MAYSEKVIDHYENPHNVGSLDKNDPNVGTGMVGAPACCDVMKLQIKVNDDGIIEEVDVNDIINIDGFKINFDKDCNKSDYFLQIESSVKNRNSLIDFYFYENNPGDDFIVDRWNFLGKHKNSEFALHIPKKFIFPIAKEKLFGTQIKLPACRELLCE
jgi:hypothetical protein